jgi:3-methyladenine DNA glycosylase AlkD
VPTDTTARDTPALDTTALAAAIAETLAARGDPARAPGQRAYLKSDRTHLGNTVPDLRSGVRTALVAAVGKRPLTAAELWELVPALWRPGAPDQIFDHCLAAVEVLAPHVAQLAPSDLPALEPYLRDARTWALVDPLADVAGRVATRHPGTELDRVLDRWSRDDDFWIRRTCLLAELKPLAAGQPLDRFARHADLMLDEQEFFVRKAIGWVLRDTAKRRPAEVVAYALPRAPRMSGVTWRELVRHLTPDDVARLERARG